LSNTIEEILKVAVKFNKNQLNTLGTALGLVLGISTVLGTQGVVDKKIAGTIGGIASVFLGYVVQRPANEPPTTEDVENIEIEKEKVENNPPSYLNDEIKLELIKFHGELVNAKKLMRDEVSKLLEHSTTYIKPIDTAVARWQQPINAELEVTSHLEKFDISQKVLAYIHLQKELSCLLNLPAQLPSKELS
jgi:hypothetical protein